LSHHWKKHNESFKPSLAGSLICSCPLNTRCLNGHLGLEKLYATSLLLAKEPLIKSGSNRLSVKMFWFKAWNARHKCVMGRAIAKFCNAYVHGWTVVE
jgi:hypothetical protein